MVFAICSKLSFNFERMKNMSKITVDIEYIKRSLTEIGYEISDVIQRENNGLNWQIKFSNSDAIITIYDSNRTKNSVVNGRPDADEDKLLKDLVNKLKCKEFSISPLNSTIVELIRSRKEDSYYDFKEIPHHDNEALLHDILCLSNNTENKDAFLIIGVTDNYSVIGVDEEWCSNNIFDFIKSMHFAGDHIPDISVEEIYYKCKKLIVIVCKSSKHVPFYLTERYKGINANQIYTRIGDTNTPKNKSANYSDVEKLWRIHFERENE